MGTGKIVDRIKRIGIRQGDFIVVALLLAISLFMLCFGMFGEDRASSVRICVDGEEIALLSLDRDTVYEVPGGMDNVVEISGGRARMLCADCPDESCIRQGYISQAGECIVCLPARVTVTVVSDYSIGYLDAVAY